MSMQRALQPSLMIAIAASIGLGFWATGPARAETLLADSATVTTSSTMTTGPEVVWLLDPDPNLEIISGEIMDVAGDRGRLRLSDGSTRLIGLTKIDRDRLSLTPGDLITVALSNRSFFAQAVTRGSGTMARTAEGAIVGTILSNGAAVTGTTVTGTTVTGATVTGTTVTGTAEVGSSSSSVTTSRQTTVIERTNRVQERPQATVTTTTTVQPTVQPVAQPAAQPAPTVRGLW